MFIFLLSFAHIATTDAEGYGESSWSSSARKISKPRKSKIFFSDLLIHLYMKIIRKKLFRSFWSQKMKLKIYIL